MKSKIYTWYNTTTQSILISNLLKKRVVLTSTDTVPGLMAIPCPETIASLNQIKIRQDKPYLLLIGNKSQLRDFVIINNDPGLYRIIDQCWPGPITLIFQAQENAPQCLLSEKKTIAIRMPQHNGILELLKKIGAVFSTSANISGHPVPQEISQIPETIKQQVSCIVTDQQNSSINSLASTIIDCTTTPLTIVRKGAYPISKIETIYGHPLKTIP